MFHNTHRPSKLDVRIALRHFLNLRLFDFRAEHIDFFQLRQLIKEGVISFPVLNLHVSHVHIDRIRVHCDIAKGDCISRSQSRGQCKEQNHQHSADPFSVHGIHPSRYSFRSHALLMYPSIIQVFCSVDIHPRLHPSMPRIEAMSTLSCGANRSLSIYA